MFITREYLRENPDHVFVFGDNKLRTGKGGAASLRDEPNTYGFITKKYPNNNAGSFFTPIVYIPVFHEELNKLEREIITNDDKIFLISKLGAGLANRHKIWEEVIRKGLLRLHAHNNVQLLWLYEFALEIYLRFAYPMNPDNVWRDKLAWLEHPSWGKNDKRGLANEARFGCHCNPHMKLRYKHPNYGGWGDSQGFYVDCNDHGDPTYVKTTCRNLKKLIEDEWHKQGLPVLGRD